MTPLLLLQIYLALGLLYGAYVVASAELKYPSRGLVIPARQRFRVYFVVMGIAVLAWPVAFAKDGLGLGRS